jgi:hypothetical protein
VTISKQERQKFAVERFNLRKQSELEIRKEYHVEISNMFTVLENLNESEDIQGLGKH